MGGLDPARVGPPPQFTRTQYSRIVEKTGLAPPEHHARIRSLLARASETARRAQIAMVEEVRSSSIFERFALERRAATIPAHVQRAKGQVRGAYAAARRRIEASSTSALATIERHATQSDREVNEAALSSAEALQSAILETTPAVQALYEETMRPVRTLLKDTAKELKDQAKNKAEALTSAGTTLAATYMASTGDAINDAQYEAKAEAVPTLVENFKPTFIDAGNDAAADVLAQETQLGLSFLSMVNPAAVQVEQQGVADQTTSTSHATSTRLRLTNDYERAKRFVELTKERTLDGLRDAERSAVEQLDRMGEQMVASARVQTAALVDGMHHAAAPGADAWRKKMARVNDLVRRGGFLNVRELEPRLVAADHDLQKFAQAQRVEFARHTKVSAHRVQEALDDELENLKRTATQSAQSANTTASEQVAAMGGVAQRFADGFRGVAQPACSEAGDFVHTTEAKLGATPEVVRREMGNMLGRVTTSFNEAVTGLGTQLQSQITQLPTILAPQLANVDAQVYDNLGSRAQSLFSAMDGPGTNESAVFGALHSLTRLRAGALEAYWSAHEHHSDSLRQWLYDDLSGDEYQAAINYLNGNAVAGARYELSSQRHWYGDDTQGMEGALRALNAQQLRALNADPAFASLHEDLRNRLRGTDLQVTEALLAGRTARADALRLRDTIDAARRRGDDDALHDALAGLRQANLTDSQNQQHLDEVRREFAHLLAGHGLDDRVTVDNATAEREFSNYVTRDVQVEHVDPETGITTTWTMRLTGPSRDLAVALATHGEGSPRARAARLAFEVSRGGDPRLDRIAIATDDPNLVAARARVRELTDHPTDANRHARERAQAELRRLERQRDDMAVEFARLRHAGDAVQGDASRARIFTETALRGMFSSDPLGQQLASSMLLDGRASPALAIRFAVRGAGTNEDLIRRTLRGMTPTQIADLRRDYGRLYGNGETDTTALDEALGTNGHGGFFTELSGDERHEVEELLLGVPQNDRDRLALARLRAHHQLGEGTWAGRAASGAMGFFNGSDPAAEMDSSLARLDQMMAAAGSSAFDQHGNFVGVPGRFTRDDFLLHTTMVGESAQNYRARIDSIASTITGAIAIIGAIVGGIVVTVLTGGGAAPLVVAAWAAGIAALTGAAAMAVNYGLKGGRYGWEQAAIDAGLTLIDAATAGLTAGAGAKAAAAARQVSALRAAARTPAQIAAAERIAAQQGQRELVRGFVRSATSAGLSGAGHTALADGTWDHGLLAGLGEVVAGGAKSAAIGLASHGATHAFNTSGLGQRLNNSLSYAGRGLGQGLGGALGGMAGRSTELLIDGAMGRDTGPWYEALGSIVQAGGRDFVQNFGQGVAEVRQARRDHAEQQTSTAQRGADNERVARSGMSRVDEAADASFRMQAARMARAIDPSVEPRAFLRQLDADVTADRIRVEQHRQLQRQLRTEALSGIPPHLRGEFANVPIRVVPDEQFERFTESRSGRAVTIFVDGEPQILLRQSASPEALREEGIHLLQSRDPQWRQRIAELDETRLAGWHHFDVEVQLTLYRNKLDIEIDAQQRLYRGLVAEMETAPADQRHALRQRAEAALASLEALSTRRNDVDAMTPRRIAAIRDGTEERPQYLDQPPRLFNKEGPELHPETLPKGQELQHGSPELEGLPRYPVAPENTTWSKQHPGRAFYQVGDAWQESTADGPRWYRMVEVVDERGTPIDRRREILQLEENTPNFRWQQRGSESTQRGAEFEGAVRLRNQDLALAQAADRGLLLLAGRAFPEANTWAERFRLLKAEGIQSALARLPTAQAELIRARLTRQGLLGATGDAQLTRLAAGRLDIDQDRLVPIGALRDRQGNRLTAQHGGGAGFDDVVIEFTQDATGVVRARIRIVEAKDSVGLSLEDFSAVTTNLDENLLVLHQAILASDLSPERREAAIMALRRREVSIDIQVSDRTGLGPARGLPGARPDSIISAITESLAIRRSVQLLELALIPRQWNVDGVARTPLELAAIRTDLERLAAVRERLDAAFRTDPFDAATVREEVRKLLQSTRAEGLRSIALRNRIALPLELPEVGAPGQVGRAFEFGVAEAAYIEAARRAGAVSGLPTGLPRPAGHISGVAAFAGHVEAVPPATVRVGRTTSGGDAVPLVTDRHGRVIAVDSPRDLTLSDSGDGPAVNRLVALARSGSSVELGEGGTQPLSGVVWDATNVPVAQVGPVLAQIRARLNSEPSALSQRLSVVVAAHEAGTPEQLRATLGLGDAVEIVPAANGRAYVIRFRDVPQPPASAPPTAPHTPTIPQTGVTQQLVGHSVPPATPGPLATTTQPTTVTAKATPPRITGADPSASPDVQTAEAERFYTQLRQRTLRPDEAPPEIGAISNHSGLTPEQLTFVYNHVFRHEHDLPVGPNQLVRQRFDADTSIARLWSSATQRPLTDAERHEFSRLMAHEYIEGRLMRMGLPYRSAHPGAWQGDLNVPSAQQFGAHDLAPLVDPMRAGFAHWRKVFGIDPSGLELAATPNTAQLDTLLGAMVGLLTAPGGPLRAIQLPSGQTVLHPPGEVVDALDLFHGTHEVGAGLVAGGIRVDVNGSNPGRSTQWGPGFYLGSTHADGHYYAQLSARGGGVPAVLRFPGVPLQSLGQVLDVVNGPHAQAWRSFLAEPLLPGLAFTRDQAWRTNPDSRGEIFVAFLARTSNNPDVVIAPHDVGQGPQVVIRSPRAAEILLRYLVR